MKLLPPIFAALFLALGLEASTITFETASINGLPTIALPGYTAPFEFVPVASGQNVTPETAFEIGSIPNDFVRQDNIPANSNTGTTAITMTVEYLIDGSLSTATFNGLIDQDGWTGAPGDYVPQDFLVFNGELLFGVGDYSALPGTDLLAGTTQTDYFPVTIYNYIIASYYIESPEPRWISMVLSLALLCLVAGHRRFKHSHPGKEWHP